MNSNYIEDFIKKTGLGIKKLILASMISSFISFVIMVIGFNFLEIPYYGLVAFIISIIDLVPLIGSGLVMIPWSVIAFISGNLQLAFGLILIYLLTFLVGQVIKPIILGKNIGLKPLYTFMISSISMVIFTPGLGAIIGSILSVLLAAYLDMGRDESLY